MPHKDPAAREAYFKAYYASEDGKAKNYAKVVKWRKRNPAKFRKQSRRSRATAREKEALKAIAEAKVKTEGKRKQVIREYYATIEKQGFKGRLNVERI